MMEDMGALNRRTNLPIRIIQDRPHQQKEALLWEEIQGIQREEQKEYGEEKETYTIRNYTQDTTLMTEVGIRKQQEQRNGTNN